MYKEQIKTTTKKDIDLKIDGEFVQQVSNYMLNIQKISKHDVDLIVKNSSNILSQCINPNQKGKTKNTGLVIGKVQSGKTSNFISLIAMAFDNGFNICVVFGGTKDVLLSQNRERIEKSFDSNQQNSHLKILDTKLNKHIINSDTIEKIINRNNKVIIIGLKNKTNINVISNIFASSQFLKDQPTIVIDDEGDQATLNTKKYSKNTNYPSAIYQSVSELRKYLNKHTFISITATPQANMLIDMCDTLSPDFGYLIQPNNQYCGLSDYHSINNEDKYVIEIPNEESSILDIDGIPDSFLKAFSMFFVSNAIRKYRGDNGPHAMLIHPSQKIKDQESLRNKVQDLLKQWQQKIKNSNDIGFESLQKKLKEAYDSYKNSKIALPEYSKLEDSILSSIKNCSDVMICNSETELIKNAKFFDTNIILGGNMVERGLTIDGLAITYIIRRAKGKTNIDNMEQRARWFGYKRKYLDICRIFTTSQIKKDFNDIWKHEEELWDTIEKNLTEGKKFKNIERIFLNNNKLLNLTRTNVARSERINFTQITEQNSFLLDKKTQEKNKEIIERIKQDNTIQIKQKKFGPYTHLFLEDLSIEYVNEKLLSKFKFPKNCNFNNNFLTQLFNLFDKKAPIKPKIDIVIMRFNQEADYDTGNRNVDSNGKILSGLMIGYSDNYIGDRKLPNLNPNKIQLQIHYIKPKNENITFKSPCICLYLPPNLVEECSKYVVQKKNIKN